MIFLPPVYFPAATAPFPFLLAGTYASGHRLVHVRLCFGAGISYAWWRLDTETGDCISREQRAACVPGLLLGRRLLSPAAKLFCHATLACMPSAFGAGETLFAPQA